MTAEQRAGLSDAALAMTQPCIDELIKDISRRVQKAGAITDTAEYQIYRAQALGEGKKAIEQAVSKQIGISEEVIDVYKRQTYNPALIQRTQRYMETHSICLLYTSDSAAKSLSLISYPDSTMLFSSSDSAR